MPDDKKIDLKQLGAITRKVLEHKPKKPGQSQPAKG